MVVDTKLANYIVYVFDYAEIHYRIQKSLVPAESSIKISNPINFVFRITNPTGRKPAATGQISLKLFNPRSDNRVDKYPMKEVDKIIRIKSTIFNETG